MPDDARAAAHPGFAALNPGYSYVKPSVNSSIRRSSSSPISPSCHVDPCGGVADVAARTGATIEGPQREHAFWIDQPAQQGRGFGVPGARVFAPGRWLEGGDTVTVGEIRFDVRHCPGHTPGHVVFAQREYRVAFVGDVLFQGSVGRTDFPRGDFDTLVRSITRQLWPLGDDMRFVPGHGPMSTFGDERRGKPFVVRE